MTSSANLPPGVLPRHFEPSDHYVCRECGTEIDVEDSDDELSDCETICIPCAAKLRGDGEEE